MQKPPDKIIIKDDDLNRLEHLGNVIEAMDFLRSEAKKSGVEEIIRLVDSTFEIIYTTYYTIVRYQMMSLPGSRSEEDSDQGKPLN